jgi:hypothetical protein
MRRFAVAAALVTLGPLVTACQDERRCREELTNAQGVVNGIDSKSPDSLRNAVAALEPAIAACEKAKLGAERSKLVEAKNQIGAQLALLERRAARKKGPALSAAELEKAQKEGDPSCPKGQAYRHAGVEKEIRCTGPQLIDMGMDAVKAYFSARNYKLTATDAPARVRAEFGAELFVFTFDRPGDTAGAKCLELYPAPGIPWREAVGRVVGGRLEKLKAGGTVSAKRGDLPLTVEDTEQKQLARIGDCSS